MSAISCHGLSKTYGGTRAVDSLDLEIAEGTVTGFLGPNGAGKTTTLRLLMDLTKRDAGTAALFGVDACQPAARESVGYQPADPAFYRRLSGRGNLDLVASLHRRPAVDRELLCDRLQLRPAQLDRPVSTYSSGMLQKLGLITALQCRPRLAILDEPANRLDPVVHHEFVGLLREIAAEGRTVFLSSHVLGEVGQACDQVVMIRAGRVVLSGPTAELGGRSLRRVSLLYRVPQLVAPAFLTAAVIDGVRVTGQIPAHRPDLVRQLLDHPDLLDLTIGEVPLEDLFLHVYDDPGPAPTESA